MSLVWSPSKSPTPSTLQPVPWEPRSFVCDHCPLAMIQISIFPVAESRALATIHPSAVLRADDRDAAYRGLVDDLKIAAKVLG